MKQLLILLFISLSFWAKAQIAYVSTVEDSILVGDKIDVKLVLSGFAPEEIQEVNWDTLSNLEFINGADTLNYPVDFDWKNGNFTGEDYVYSRNELNWQTDESTSPQEIYNTFELTVWEMCAFVIPPPIITLTNGETLQVGSRALIVKSPLFEDLKTELANSYGIDAEEKTMWDYLMEYWWLGALFLAAIIAFFIRNRLKNRPVPEPVIQEETPVEEPVIPPSVIALERLKKLKDERMWETAGEKQYVSELTEIIREYIENRFDIKALEMTSSEILQAMQADLLNEIQLEQLSNTLNVADMIKFAKSKADASLHEKFVDDAIDMVESSKEKPAADVK